MQSDSRGYQEFRPLIISAGFPCTDASTARIGAKGLDGESTGLFWEALRIVDELCPEYFFMENVAGLVDRGRGWGRICAALAERGYCVWYRIVSAAAWGFPFDGKRLLAVAFSPSLGLGLEEVEYFDFLFGKIAAEEKIEHVAGEVSSLMEPENYDRLLAQDDGLPRRLVERRLHAIGNSVQPAFTATIFKTIRDFDEWLTP